MIKPNENQLEAINHIKRMLEGYEGEALVRCPTGAGMTLIMLEAMRGRQFIVAERHAMLAEQWKEFGRRIGMMVETYHPVLDKRVIDASVTIVVGQSCRNDVFVHPSVIKLSTY